MPTHQLNFKSTNQTWTLKAEDAAYTGYPNSGQFSIYNGATKLWGITESGFSQTPLRPAFNVYAPVGTMKTTITFNSVRYNITNSMNPSNGLFTCPIAGIYNFSFQILFTLNPSSYVRPLWIINGSRSTTYGDTLEPEVVSWQTSGMAMSFNLNVGDTIGIYIFGGNDVYGTNYGAFSGFLVS